MGKISPLPIVLLTLLLASYSTDAGILFANEPRQERGRIGYGQNCSDTLKCVTASWLSCQNSTCQCVRPNEMKYDKAHRVCVTLTGERCLLGINKGPGSDELIIYAITGCDANAHCNKGGICVCSNNTFFETSSGSCNPKLGHLKPCNSVSEYEPGTEAGPDIECLDSLGLSCQTGQCRCKDLKSEYSDLENQCVGLGGQPCINSKCSQHAHCSIENICQCQNNFYLNPDDGVCLPKIDPLQNCTEDVQCLQIGGESLVCLDGVCNCDPAKSVYANARVSIRSEETGDYTEFNGFEGPVLNQCVGLVDSDCVDRLCAPNAFCSYNAPLSEGTTRRDYNNYPSLFRDLETGGEERNNSGTCKCASGYTKTKSHKCGVSFNSACDSTSDCTDGLICRNLECVCPYNIQRYEEAQGTCVSQIGGPCDPSPNNPALSCEENAYCKAINSTTRNQGQKVAGHCVCQNGRIEDAGGNCIPGYGGACRVNSDCDIIAQLDCIDQKCACPAFQEYNASWRKCVGLVGAKCNLEVEKECTDNAHCAPWYQKQLQGSCACNEGFEENHHYTCDPAAGAGVSVADDAEL